MRVPLILALIAFGPIGLANAYADSDGYYCVGRGYLAYQFGMNTPGNPPRVSIIRTTTPGGVPAPLELRLPPFQVHGMQCGDGWVDVTAFTAVYRIVLDENDRPVRYETRPLPPRALSGSTPNLGTLSRARGTLEPERVALGETSGGTAYVLITTAKLLPPANRCRLAITTRIAETDQSGNELRARVIFQGEGSRECGD